ncbi:MAG: segregation/condensation protein A [Clostridiales bacterium]|nr:segregation/condensation protein A [Clostridiales bacterium]
MDRISFKLEVFEGPLDLLLHLISKHKLNINDIEISKLLEQYLLYMEDLTENNFDIAGDFLEMAAKLIYIKTVSLLPKPNDAEEIKKELEGSLIEYSLCKRVAKLLETGFVGNDIFVREPTKLRISTKYELTHSSEVLKKAYNNLSLRNIDERPILENRINNIIRHKMVSVTTKVVHILRKLYTVGYAQMDSLYDGITERSERVATFLAILELTKSGRIRISEDNSEIYFIGRKKRFANA